MKILAVSDEECTALWDYYVPGRLNEYDHIFGFTGTPIFSINAGTGGNPNLKTTEQAFGDKLHTYTIVDAINDGNVLPPATKAFEMWFLVLKF